MYELQTYAPSLEFALKIVTILTKSIMSKSILYAAEPNTLNATAISKSEHITISLL